MRKQKETSLYTADYSSPALQLSIVCWQMTPNIAQSMLKKYTNLNNIYKFVSTGKQKGSGIKLGAVGRGSALHMDDVADVGALRDKKRNADWCPSTK